eukprot:m.140145 g.140145  ORF g.140145 m.140145 type:complete len:479 (+) comp22782_c0_seq1:75-1511(+)
MRGSWATGLLAATALLASPRFSLGAEASLHRSARATDADVGCALASGSTTRLDCTNLAISEIPTISDGGVSRVDLKGNAIHDGSGQLTAAQLSNVKFHPGLTEIQLQSNGINAIAVGAFDGFDNLLILRVFGNDLVSLDADAFRGLTSLAKLYLNSNPLASLVSGVFGPFQSTLTDLFLHETPDLVLIEDGSINALSATLSLDMVNSASACAIAPPGTGSAFACLCAAGYEGDSSGYCEPVPTAEPTAAPVTAAPVTSAPVTAAPTASEVDRTGDTTTSPDTGKKGKKGAADAGANPDDRADAGDASSSAKKGKKGADSGDNSEDRVGTDPVAASSPKGKKGTDAAANPNDRIDSGSGSGSGAADRVVDTASDAKKAKKGDAEDGAANRVGTDTATTAKESKKAKSILGSMQSATSSVSNSGVMIFMGGLVVAVAAEGTRRRSKSAAYRLLHTADLEMVVATETDSLLEDETAPFYSA